MKRNFITWSSFRSPCWLFFVGFSHNYHIYTFLSFVIKQNTDFSMHLSNWCVLQQISVVVFPETMSFTYDEIFGGMAYHIFILSETDQNRNHNRFRKLYPLKPIEDSIEFCSITIFMIEKLNQSDIITTLS